MYELKNKVVFITGAARGLGKHLAELSLLNGVKGLVITDMNEELLIKTWKELSEIYGERSNILYFHHDVRISKHWHSLWEEVESKLGPIDVLINNAGVASLTDWEICVDTNLKGTLHGGYLAIEKMKGRGGRIINIASFGGIVDGLGSASESGYTVSKNGIVAFTRSLSVKSILDGKTKPNTYQSDFHGIKSYAICPIFIDTSMLDVIDKSKLTELLSVEEVGKALLKSLELDQNGASYSLIPGCPIMEFPFLNGFAFALIVTEGLLLKKIFPNLEVLLFRHVIGLSIMCLVFLGLFIYLIFMKI